MENRTWVEIVQANVQRFGDLVVGIDPSLPDVPHAFVRDGGANWIANYVDFILDTVEGHVGFVKFQSAYFEARGLIGLNALSVAMHRAKAAGMGVILDAKRGDIGATATAYAQAYLAPASAGGSGDFEADCLTINPLMGPDTLAPFVDCAGQFGKGLFVLCRTSNPGAGWIQDKMAGNRLISDHVADLIAALAIGEQHSLSPFGAVIGATVPQEGRRLRQLLPRSIILAPGLGAQGGDVTAIHSLRGSRIGDLLVPVSRGLTRVDDRDVPLDVYRSTILERVGQFRTAIAYDYNETRAAVG
ncbi:orotidine-5'-phosphate decarboxylase [Devosia sp.]|uniref:orotidine-5'-phosphate decarboxylase n=1 Tax=Devosia sp. TaxID=1871048 RepID=UPI002FCC870F